MSRVTFRIPSEKVDALEAAAGEDETVSDVLREAVDEYLANDGNGGEGVEVPESS